MKKLIFFIAIIFSTKNFATNYYFSNAGNDTTNTGKSATSPYKTINKLNTILLVAGDSVLFRCGDVFRGEINLKYSGSSSKYIVFSSYGSGAKPIISGAEVVNSWIQNGSRYEAVFSQKMNNFFVNDAEQTIARYPNNNQYLTLDSAQKNYLKDASLSSMSASYFTNASVCVHTAQWCWEKSAISSFSNSSKITYSTPMHLAAINNYGYFIYDNINLLDTANEWKYDSANAKLYYIPQSSVNPNTQVCEAAIYSNGLSMLSNVSYIAINNIQFEKQMNAGVVINTNCQNILIDNCVFAHQYNYGVSNKGKHNEISNNSFLAIDGIAMFVNNGGGNSNIHHNNFKKIGLVRNNGIGAEINGSAIKMAFADSNHIHHNNIDSAGYCGISVDGTYNTTDRNIISNVMLCNNDGAALKSFGGSSQHNIFENNFITSSDGNKDGTYQANFITPAIYFDFNVNNSIIRNNVVYGRTQKGIFQNAGDSSNTIYGNTIYGANIGIDLNNSNLQPTPIKNMSIKQNVFWMKNKTDYIFRQIDAYGTYQFGTIDSNYYFQPYKGIDSVIYRLNGMQPSPLSFAIWQNAGNDIHTKFNDFRWSNGVDSSAIFINASDNVVAQNLQGYTWKDLDGNIVTSLTLQPWSSKILVKMSSVLPTTIVNYEARVANGKQILNTWQLANEENVSTYRIQRSNDGKNFETVGSVAANGLQQYSYADNLAAFNTASVVFYYMLEVEYKDGEKVYSAIKKITIDFKQATLRVYPNPAVSKVTVECSNAKEIVIVDCNGRVINKQVIDSLNSNTTFINYQLLRGVYFVRAITSNGSIKTEKLIVQ